MRDLFVYILDLWGFCGSRFLWEAGLSMRELRVSLKLKYPLWGGQCLCGYAGEGRRCRLGRCLGVSALSSVS